MVVVARGKESGCVRTRKSRDFEIGDARIAAMHFLVERMRGGRGEEGRKGD
jgi:hypothetical protein